MNKAIFLTSRNSLNMDSEISGGVQYCSREFYNVLKKAGFELELYYIPYTRNLFDRLFIKLQIGIYCMFNLRHEDSQLVNRIEENEIEYVFLNMAGIIRYSKFLRLKFGSKLKIYLLSHGNDSGDFLHEIEMPKDKNSKFIKTLKKIRLGFLIAFESEYRKKYLDGVFCVSKVEANIESWLGAKKTFFIPRIVDKKFMVENKPIHNHIGFVGRLDHGPNVIGLKMLLNELSKHEIRDLKIRLVGAPHSWGNKISKEFSFVTYLGELTDQRLEEEVKSWSLFLNPVFWYSTGVTTKLAKSIEWELPTITTKQGARGYVWKEGIMLMADDPRDMAGKIIGYFDSEEQRMFYQNEIKKIKNSSPTLEDVAKDLTNLNV